MSNIPSTTTTATNSKNTIHFTLPKRLFQHNEEIVVLKCIDCHAAGEPARVVLSGVPEFPEHCTTALLKRSYMMDHWDHLRKILLQEPRGYPCQNANFVFCTTNNNNNESETTTSTKIQYVIAEQNKIYPLMSGHNTICVATAVLECGVIPMVEPISKFVLQAPAGPIHIEAHCNNGKAQSIALRNAPAFVEHLSIIVNVPHGIGPVVVDVAYGGMWYAIVDIQQFQDNPELQHLKHLRLDPNQGAELCRVGEMIKVACREQFPVQHPTEDYPGVDILAFRGSPSNDNDSEGVHAKNAVIMSNNVLDWEKPGTWTAMIDRSPCGTGTCAIMAVLYERGMLKIGEEFVHESIIGSIFVGKILEPTTVGPDQKRAIIPQVSGSAYITQYSEVVVDPTDPFPQGYRVADIW